MDNKFTDKIKEWLDADADKRDYGTGALYLLKLSGNTNVYRNNIATLTLKNTQQFIAYQLQKFYDFLLATLKEL